MATVYAIASAKGGVGKTTTTAAVATLLAESGADVVAIDADIGMANLADALGVGPGETTIHDVLAGEAEPEAAVHDGPHGLRVVPGEKAIDAYAAADPSNLREVVEAFADADYVLLDAGAGLSHDSTLPLGLADETLLVSTLERSALGDTEKTRQLAERLGGSVAGAALTRVDPKDPDDRNSVVREVLNADILGRIPEDAAISRASAAGSSVVSAEPGAPASQAYRDLTRALTGADIEEPEESDDSSAPEEDDSSAPEEIDDSSAPEEDDSSAPEADDDLIVADEGPVGIGDAGDEDEIIVADERPIEDSDGTEDDIDETDAADETADTIDETGKVDKTEKVDETADTANETADAAGETGEADETGEAETKDDSGDEEHAIDDGNDEPAESADEEAVTEHIPNAEGPESEKKTEPESDIDEELAGSIPFRDDDSDAMETALSRTDEDESEADGTDADSSDESGDDDDEEKSGFFSRLLGR